MTISAATHLSLTPVLLVTAIFGGKTSLDIYLFDEPARKASGYIDQVLIHRGILPVALRGKATAARQRAISCIRLYTLAYAELMLVGIADLCLHIVLRSSQCVSHARLSLNCFVHPLPKDSKFFCRRRIIAESPCKIIASYSDARGTFL